MDFGWSDDQLSFKKSVVEFAQRELAGASPAANVPGAFPSEEWRRCAEFGIQGLAVAKEHGGAAVDTQTLLLAMEALGYGCTNSGLIFSLSAQILACQHPIQRFGTQMQKGRYLPGLCDGSLVAAHAMTEPGAGSDTSSMSTTARREGDIFVLNGSKTFVTNGPVADLFLVFAVTDQSRKFAGVTAFLVERRTPGCKTGPPLDKMGLTAAPISDLALVECRVPAEAVLGEVGAGMMVFNAGMERERGLILASTIGVMERTLEQSLDRARERCQFGQPIGKFQAISHRLVEMKVRLETARLLLYRVGWLFDNGRPSPLDTALAKLYVSECFVASSLDALQVFGGYGYLSAYQLEGQLRDAVGSRLYSGTSEIQRNLAARFLGL